MPRLTATAAVVAVVVSCLPGCSQQRGAPEPPGVTPPVMFGTPVIVDACFLLPPVQASAILARPLSIVGTRVEPPRLETVRCDLGRRFGEPLVSIELTTDPIAFGVFEAAYGEAAGGDPRWVRGTGRPSIWRAEPGQRTIRTFVHGAVIAVESNDRLAPPLGRKDMVELSRRAVSRLPRNPVLSEQGTIDRCGSVPDGVVEPALGRPPSIETELSFDGDVQCSWGGQPGSVVVTVIDDPRDVRRFAQLTDDVDEVEVDGLTPREAGRAWSSTKVAGDLFVLSHDRALSLEVTPAAGFSDPEIATTPPELALARVAAGSLS